MYQLPDHEDDDDVGDDDNNSDDDDDDGSKGGRGTGRPNEGREGRRETIKELNVHLRISLLFIHSC